MGFSSSKNICEIRNLLESLDSILSNYRRMGVKRQIYIVYKHTDIFKTWTVSGDATSIFWASLTISGSGRPSAKRDRHIFFKFRTRSRNNYLPLVREFCELRAGQFFVTLDNARPRLL